MQTPLLQTERLTLRPITLGDAPAVQKHFNNWSIIRNLSTVVPWPYPPDGAEGFIRGELRKIADGNENYIWVLVPKDGPDEAIGSINFRRVEKGNKGNRGFWLAEPYWRRGLMTEAVNAVNDFIFGTLGVTEYFVCNAADNAGSRRVKQKTGAQFVGSVEIAHHSGGTRSERWVVRAK
jgi:[ribosomal protein S5]-alanine N-acetyltransferase